MMIFISGDADDAGRKIGDLRLQDDAEALRAASNALDAGNDLWAKWAVNSGGSVVSAGGEFCVQVPVDLVGQIEALRDRYHDLVGATVSIGVGTKISDSSKALQAAKLKGKDRIEYYTPEVDRILKEAVEGSGSSDGYLGKALAENHGAGAGFGGFQEGAAPVTVKPAGEQSDHTDTDQGDRIREDQPSPEATHAAADLERQLHEAAWQGEEEDSGHDKTEAASLDRARGQLARALKIIKEQAPVAEQLRDQAPKLYDAVMGLSRSVVGLARALPESKRSPADREVVQKAEELAKSNRLEKMALIHDDAKNPKTVWRVQNESGEGPYTAEFGSEADRNEVVSAAGRLLPYGRQPVPSQDFIHEEWAGNPDRKGHLFGFEKPEHAHEWFGGANLEDLARQGFHLKEVPAVKVYRSKTGKRVLFQPHDEWKDQMGKKENQGLEKGKLPTPSAPTRTHLNLPVGSVVGHKVKVQHGDVPGDTTTSWVQVGAGQVRSQDPSGHPVSARSPNSR